MLELAYKSNTERLVADPLHHRLLVPTRLASQI